MNLKKRATIKLLTVFGILGISIITLFIINICTMKSEIDKPCISTPNEVRKSISTICETTIIEETTKTRKNVELPSETENSTLFDDVVKNETEPPTESLTENNRNFNTMEEDKEVKNSKYLLNIDNPDYNYIPKSFNLSESEKYDIACVVMGEFGGGGFTGCALIAQAIRDAMQTYGYSANDALVNMGYYGYNGSPNYDSYDAIDYIFSGNAAVQHRILYMNNTYSAWHESQNFICEYQGVRFFDAW